MANLEKSGIPPELNKGISLFQRGQRSAAIQHLEQLLSEGFGPWEACTRECLTFARSFNGADAEFRHALEEAGVLPPASESLSSGLRGGVDSFFGALHDPRASSSLSSSAESSTGPSMKKTGFERLRSARHKPDVDTTTNPQVRMGAQQVRGEDSSFLIEQNEASDFFSGSRHRDRSKVRRSSALIAAPESQGNDKEVVLESLEWSLSDSDLSLDSADISLESTEGIFENLEIDQVADKEDDEFGLNDLMSNSVDEAEPDFSLDSFDLDDFLAAPDESLAPPESANNLKLINFDEPEKPAPRETKEPKPSFELQKDTHEIGDSEDWLAGPGGKDPFADFELFPDEGEQEIPHRSPVTQSPDSFDEKTVAADPQGILWKKKSSRDDSFERSPTAKRTATSTPVAPSPAISHQPLAERCKLLEQEGELIAAVVLAQDLLAEAPDPELQAYYDQLAGRIQGMAVEFIKPLDRVPHLNIPPAEIFAIKGIDHRAGYLLSQVDGSIDIEFLIDLGAMPREEVAMLLLVLTERGILSFE